jgi:hypothetical protein
MVSEFVFILTVVLRVTPVVFTVGERKSLGIVFICNGTAVYALNFSSMCTLSSPHPLGYKLTDRLSSHITSSITIKNNQCVILTLPKLMKKWSRTSTPTIQHKTALHLRAWLGYLH